MNPIENKYFSHFYTEKAIGLYIATLIVVSAAFYQYAMHWYWMVFGLIEVVGFFYFSNMLTHKWERYTPKLFQRSIFGWGFAIRFVFVCFSFWWYNYMTGIPFEFHVGDAYAYDELARFGAARLRDFDFNFYPDMVKYSGTLAFSDSGYPIYLSFIYALTGDSIFLSRVLKCAWSAWTCVLIYKFTKRNFGENVARIAAIFCMLMPNMIYYCGLSLKETEMVFLVVLFIERGDALLRSTKFMFWPTFLVVVIGILLFSFRTVLGGVLFISILLAAVLTSGRVTKWWRRILIFVLVLGFGGVLMQNRIEEEIREIAETDVVSQQQGNMQWRSERDKGNEQSFAKYAGAAVFAPMIFTIPFPTMVESPEHENQRMLHGGYFVKNITSLFTILALVLLAFYDDRRGKWTFLQGPWRRHVLPMAFIVGYLFVLVFSSFAQAERFHLPTIPFAMMFAAYGIAHFPKKWNQWYWIWIIVIFIANVAWSWFKLAGRGMI